MWEYAEAQRLRPANPELPLHLASVLEKGKLVDAATAQLVPALRAEPKLVDEVIDAGTKKATAVARQTITEVNEAMKMG